MLTCTIGRKRTCAKFFFKDIDSALVSLEKLVRPMGWENSQKVSSGLDRKVKSQINVNGMFSFGLNTASKVKGVNIKKANLAMNSN